MSSFRMLKTIRIYEAKKQRAGSETNMAEFAKVERFKDSELTDLRLQLVNSSYDSWQAADVVSEFLTGRGYGASPERVRHALVHVNLLNLNGLSTSERMQEALEKIAFVN